MSPALIVVLALGGVTMALKGAGPVVLEGRPLPPAVTAIVVLLGPSLLAALIAVQTLDGGRAIVLDERIVGVGAAALALRFGAPPLIVVVIAAAVTGGLRAIL